MEVRRKRTYQDKKLAKEEYDKGSCLYFKSIRKLPTLFIAAKKASDPYIYLDIRNLIVLLIFEAHNLEKWVNLCIVLKSQEEKSSCDSPNNLITLKYRSTLSFENSTEILFEDRLRENYENTSVNNNIFKQSRKHPSITVEDKGMVICGISSVLRFVFKYVCHKIDEVGLANSPKTFIETLSMLKQFLGFRGGCLQACAESSIWTKFCEVDMIDSVNEIAKILKPDVKFVNPKDGLSAKVPENILRFENHLSLPVKIHNVQRVVQDVNKTKATVKVDELSPEFEKNVVLAELKHEFAEGTTLLLSDLILFPSFHTFVVLLGNEAFAHLFPRTLEWHDKIYRQFFGNPIIEINDLNAIEPQKISWFTPENLPIQSLYLRDTKRYKPSLRQFTRQYEIEEALEFLQKLGITSLEMHQDDPNFKWNEIPRLAHPEGGCLPVSRQQRKCDQLASMVFYALQIYSSKKHQFDNTGKRFRAVDFCSGGGHVGILLAWLLPNCDVVLVENKDESLRRAQERIDGLGLSNVFCYQSNLDYFESHFDLGMALHACGTATDLVISKCVKVNASFVCCPCCYGAVQENHILTYPRSTIFQKVSLRHYLVLCHASDQTQAEEKTDQGKHCMAIVDTDRCLYAAEYKYDVKLCKIVPETASPKNHILVGISG